MKKLMFISNLLDDPGIKDLKEKDFKRYLLHLNDQHSLGSGIGLSIIFLIAYLIFGNFFIFLSGTTLLFINAILISLIIPFFMFYLKLTDSDFWGIGFASLLSLAFAIHTSGPILTPSSFCSSTWSTTTKVTPSLGFEDGQYTYQEEQETRRVSDRTSCMRDSVGYMMNSEVHGKVFILSWGAFVIFGLIFFFNIPKPKKNEPKKNNHPLDQEILNYEQIMEDVISNEKTLPKSFYKQVMKVSDMLDFYDTPQNHEGNYVQVKGGRVDLKISRIIKIENLLQFASEKAPETFKGDNKQIQKSLKETLQIIYILGKKVPETVRELQELLINHVEFLYRPTFYEDQHVSWWVQK